MAVSREELEAMLVKADAAGDTEAVNQIFDELDALDAPVAQDAAPVEQASTAQNIGRSAVKGVSETLGFPGEAVLGLAKAGGAISGQDTSAIDDLSPSDAFKDIFASIGLRSDPGEPSSAGEQFAMNATEAVAGGLTGIGAASRAKGIISKTSQKLLQGRLGRFAAEDILSATGGAALKTVGQETGQSDTGSSALELAGNILVGSAADKVMRPFDAARSGKKALRGVKERAKNEASRVVQSAITEAGEDPAALARQIRMDEGEAASRMTAGPKSRSPALQSMERALISLKDNAAFADQYQRYQGDFDSFVRDSIKAALGGDGVTDEFVDEYMRSSKYAIDVAEKRLQQATIEAADEISQLPPIENIDYGIDAKRKIEAVYKEMNDLVKEAWDAVPDAEVTVKNSRLTETLDEIYGKGADVQAVTPAYAGRAMDAAGNPIPEPTVTKAGVQGELEPDPAKLPDAWIRNTIESYANQGSVPAKAIQALRSSILDDARVAASQGQRNKSRRLYRLAEASLEVLDRAESSYPEQLDYARSLTRDFKERMDNDVIAPLLGTSKRGDDIVPDNQTLEKLFRPGQAGRTNMIALKGVFKDEVPEEAKNYILQQLFKKAMPDGTISVKNAEKFKRDYFPTLEETGLTPLIDRYVAAGKRVEEASTALAKQTSTQAKDVAAQVIKTYGPKGDDLVQGIASSFRSTSGNATTKIADLFRTATTPEAEAGLKTAITEGAIKSIYTAGGGISDNFPDYNRRIVQALEESGKYTDEDIARYKKVAEAAYLQSQSKKVKILKGQSNTASDTMRSNALGRLLKVASLRWVAPAVNKGGPGSLSTAQMIGDMAMKIGRSVGTEDAQNLINRAIFDQDLMAALLENPDTMTEASASVIRRALKATAKAVGRTVAGGTVQPSQAQIYGNTEEENGN